ncbi:MAG: Peptidoglycan glycosyltransferase [Candidatus Amesbacteria bacterium GW2011_GWA1_47_16]|uniref:Peptidoglycan glycosyltransferase, cell division protein FtsI (Penicillin-binding protein 3) n=5 Tax=Candidatus Amesiibacteriota TaxID=1752730 RepID=A0A0G1S5X4_9BACT|nr:MAG: peptidoglycan glycosyltransferase, cell division protein FtsI (penicillin-binding protein 3) [Candidatus Amesbacteria bacterium GW2011_GWC1_47_15]KKU65127.1 MAG: Peptidoglycan glycosyltransferase [Candidatus Amesbacteria bacterium GW2011_GWA1_47_16]KKU97755.1 MAG: Peptidoglycan glycosyltransferase [Candidatus Amesbacteria bacterium GW2011_GWB1_48_13]OGC99801.1 MAG: hypothetical protein A2701_03400 [Candidatus Amesbacteria bacterium RIFCSPHIGHO2_01_FULL_47_34]OGD01217.1 MAG: hypothetical
MKGRISLLKVVFLFWTVVLLSRLFYLQVFRSSVIKRQAADQYSRSTVIPAARGEIRASDGFPLVTNLENYLLFINPREFSADKSVVSDLADILPASDSARRNLEEAISGEYAWKAVSRSVPADAAEKIRKLNLAGIGLELDPSRLYPEGSPSGYLTGFVGKDEQGYPKGYFGLEGYYDRLLSGKPGKLVQEIDAFGHPILIADRNRIPPQNGQSLITSIDRTVLYIAYTKLQEGLEKYQAASGTVSIMESETGKILAMASLPGYDPAKFSNYPSETYTNPIVSEGFEPGSTFKVVIMASALDAGVVKPDTVCGTCSGPVTIFDQTVRSWNDKYYPGSTMSEVILHSDNVGMVFVSRQLGKKKMLQSISKFGFGEKTGIDLQEEDSPTLRPEDEWRDIDIATAAFGQGIAVTRIQMLTAVNALANLGKLIPPKVVTGISQGREIKNQPPVRRRQVISPQAAAAVTTMMINGVEKGEVRYYKPQGFLIAGKTGTAQVPIQGHYDKDKTVSSFIGFAPADAPKFTMLVTLRDPQTSPWGSTTAAPLWFDIARELFRYYRIPPRL